MLILTRRVGETVMIGEEVSVTILGVLLGFDLPEAGKYHRASLQRRDGRVVEGAPLLRV
ncbi:MAG: carbon storage regulator [Gammaproteobacteria bacterium]|nr:carbon storage regulator [Gammaproteobacteria bacterium]